MSGVLYGGLAANLFRQQLTGSAVDIATVIAFYEESLKFVDPKSEQYMEFVSSLALAFRARFKQLGDVKDLDHAIFLHLEGISLCSYDNPRFSTIQHALRVTLDSKYGHFQDSLPVLESIITLEWNLLGQHPVGHSAWGDFSHFRRSLDAATIQFTRRLG